VLKANACNFAFCSILPEVLTVSGKFIAESAETQSTQRRVYCRPDLGIVSGRSRKTDVSHSVPRAPRRHGSGFYRPRTQALFGGSPTQFPNSVPPTLPTSLGQKILLCVLGALANFAINIPEAVSTSATSVAFQQRPSSIAAMVSRIIETQDFKPGGRRRYPFGHCRACGGPSWLIR